MMKDKSQRTWNDITLTHDMVFCANKLIVTGNSLCLDMGDCFWDLEKTDNIEFKIADKTYRFKKIKEND